MLQTQLQTIQCPYCGEAIDIIIDPSIDRQEYFEDCAVCCRPISLTIEAAAAGDIAIHVASEHDC